MPSKLTEGMPAWERAARVIHDAKPPRGVGGAECHDPVKYVLAYGREIEAAARKSVIAEVERAIGFLSGHHDATAAREYNERMLRMLVARFRGEPTP